jgi:hypothetical protein
MNKRSNKFSPKVIEAAAPLVVDSSTPSKVLNGRAAISSAMVPDQKLSHFSAGGRPGANPRIVL